MERIDLLLSKKKLLDDFYHMVMKERECIEREEWKRVENIISSKEYKLLKVNRIDKKLKNRTMDNAKSKEEKKLHENIEALIISIQIMGQENIHLIEEMIKESKKQLKDIQVKQKVNSAYYQPEEKQKDGCFIDKLK
ncbi:MAG: hypothetical protein WC996_01555 [Peptostreptococcales bacterium]